MTEAIVMGTGYSPAGQFTTVPEMVEAKQFLGYSSALDIFGWLPMVFYIPIGGEHQLRSNSEYDRSRGDVRPDATDFLLLRIENTIVRVDYFYWIVKHSDETVEVYSQEEFEKKFRVKETETMND